MAVLVRITDFIPNTIIESQEMDDELNQLVNILSGVSTNKDALFRYSHATDPVLRVDQLGAGVIQQWLQNGVVKARINNDGSFLIDGSTDTLLKANGQIVGYYRVVERNTTAVGNVGTGLDTLHSFNLPANSLATDGDMVRVVYGGALATNDNDKRVVASFGGQVYLDPSVAIDLDMGGWRAEVDIVRVSATTVRVSARITINIIQVQSGPTLVNNSSWQETRNSTLTVADLGANATTMLVQGETGAASDNDVVQNLSIIELCQMT